jgi:LCP family protein required for cell wall assembly
MADRPYRTYRGGRVRPEPEAAAPAAVAAPERRGAIELPAADAPPPIQPPRLGRLGRFGRGGGTGWSPSRRAPRGLRFWLKLGIALAALLVGLWLLLGLLAVRSSVSQANERLDPRASAALAAPDGSILAVPTSILVIGVDEAANSDTLQVIRFDPGDSLVSTLSIPRDLRVPVPGYGEEKINAAYAAGGAPLALQAVQAYTGLEIDHVIVLDFDGLVGLVDAVGGIEVDNPKPIRSVFEGEMHKFPAGTIALDGQEALAYSRVRRNALDPSDSDVSRGQRQQAVIRALRERLTSPGGVLRLRTVAGALGGAFATDLTLGEIGQLAWVDQRASRRLRCNLGGTPAPLDGQDVLIPDGAGNRRVLGEFLGEQAVQPAASRSLFAARCRAG